MGKQTLHVTQDHLGSVVKVVFNIYDTENDTDNNADTPNPSWKHAVRPRTTDPVFPAEKVTIHYDCCKSVAFLFGLTLTGMHMYPQ